MRKIEKRLSNPPIITLKPKGSSIMIKAVNMAIKGTEKIKVLACRGQ